jgi:hypothetical protein
MTPSLNITPFLNIWLWIKLQQFFLKEGNFQTIYPQGTKLLEQKFTNYGDRTQEMGIYSGKGMTHLTADITATHVTVKYFAKRRDSMD